MRLFAMSSVVLLALACTAAQAQSAYRCNTPEGMVFQDRPCSSGASVRVHKAAPPPAPAAEEAPRAQTQQELQLQLLQLQTQQKILEQERLAAEGPAPDAPAARPPPKTGQQNMEEYLNARDRQREQLRSEQRRAFDGEDARTAPGSALSRVDNRLRDLRMRRDSMAATPQERSRASYQEERLLRLRPGIAEGSSQAMREAEDYMY